MTELRLAVSLLLLLTLPLAQAETLTGRVVRVTDGDTIVVLDASKVQHKIRLTGIDAPERGQAFGTKSKEHLSDLVAGKSVVVDYSKYDRYQRILGKVLVNGEDVNLEQVEAGYGMALQEVSRRAIPLRPREVFRCRARGEKASNSGCGMILIQSALAVSTGKAGTEE